MNVRPLLKGLWGWTKRNSTKILAGGAIVAEALGFYFMHKEAPIVRDRLEELPEGSKWYEKLKVAGPIYLPAIGMFILSSGRVIGGCAMGERKAAIMASLYSASEASLRRLEKKMMEEIGEERAGKVHAKVAQDVLNERGFSEEEVENTGKGNTLFFEPWTGRYFRSSLDAVKNDVADYNKDVTSRCWATFNDFFDYIGIRNAKCADGVGYNLDHKLEVVYIEGSVTHTKELCWVMRYIEDPLLYNGKHMRNFSECENCYIE